MDGSYSDIIVILDRAYETRLDEAIGMLKTAGMTVDGINGDDGVVTGQAESGKVDALEHLPCVDYVRRTFTYDANFPPGDPRDRDGA